MKLFLILSFLSLSVLSLSKNAQAGESLSRPAVNQEVSEEKRLVLRCGMGFRKICNKQGDCECVERE